MGRALIVLAICAVAATWTRSARADDAPAENAPAEEPSHDSDSAPQDEGTTAPANNVGSDDDNTIATPRPRYTAPKPAKPAHAKPADAPAAAQPSGGQQYGSHRIQVFLIPLGATATSLAAAPVQAALEQEAAKMPGYHPVDLVAELAAPMPAPLKAKVREAKEALTEGNKAIAGQQYPDAAERYQHAVDVLEEAGPAAEVTAYAEAYVRLAVALQYAGEDEPAKLAFRNAARLDQGKAIDGRAIDNDLGSGLDRARKSIAESPAGTLSVVSNPPGARVWIDGVFRGTAPISVDHLPIGTNYVKLDRPGALPVVQLIEVKEAQDVPVRIQMKFTDETREIQETLTQIPDALVREPGVPAMVKAIGKRFRLERAVVATARMIKTNLTEVRVAIFDLPRDVRLVDEKGLFTVDADTGLQNDVAKWARGVIDRADHSRDRAAKDPLRRGDGTEDWYDTENTRTKTATAAAQAKDDQAGEAPSASAKQDSDYHPTPTHEKGKKSKDPLDTESGQEDW